MESSKLFKMLNVMPKGAIHHIHTTAANPIDAYLKLTYDDRTYYSQREDLFKVYPKHQNVEEGYLQTTVLRSFAQSDEEFDKNMKNVILLGPEQANDRESHEIWKFFQHKFTKVGQLGKFIPFFKELIKTALERCINQNVFIVEFRHISGMLFDDEMKGISLLEELKIIRAVIDDLQKTTPHFEFKLVLTGLKIVGKKHIDQMLQDIKDGANEKDKRIAELIAGFDMVNEEDYTPEIGDFALDVL